jgi:Uncharacterized conserved protein
MTLGALVDIGVALAMLREELAKLPVTGYRLEASTVKRGGLRGTKVEVLVDEVQPARKYTDIVEMIAGSKLHPAVQKEALEIFRRLGEVEAHLHGEPLEAVHFHEVGAVDSIVDVVGAVIGLHALKVSMVMASPINVGSGLVRTAHGLLPVPAPATLELLKGCPSYASDTCLEMTTPTGAAILTTVVSRFGTFPLMRVEKIGYGAGTKDPAGIPNLLRIILGETEREAETAGHDHHHPPH